MNFRFGQRIAVKTRQQGMEFVYPCMGMVLGETETDLVLLFPDGRVTINKADLL